MMIGSLAIVALGALAGLSIARFLRNRKLQYMANAGAVVGAESHGSGNISFAANAAFVTQVAAHQTSGYAHNGRYLLVKAVDESIVTSATAYGESGVFAVCTDEPDVASTASPRKFNCAILGNATGTIPVAVGGTVAAMGRVVAGTDGTAQALYADGNGHGGTYYVIGRLLRAKNQGDIGELCHCTPYAVTVSQ